MNDKKRLICEIDKELHQKAKVRAYQENKTLTDKMVELIREWLNK
jgi:tRNA isopentenyl-2-thiomethyl-A-37 hydroxylase MiaE